MTRYADPTRCPDCGAAIVPGAPACGTCALTLQGETAQRLFQTLSQADALLGALRAASVPTVATAGSAAAPRPMPVGAPRPEGRRGLPATSVPKLLLGLGAGCLLVAALVFLAVTWSVLGVGGRTATLVGFTAVAGGLAAWFARRALRGAAEALSLVGYGLLTLDVVGADNASWFGHLDAAALLVVVGAVLAGAGTAGALAVRRTPVGSLTTPEVTVLVGTALMALGVGSGGWWALSASLVAATLVGAGVTVAAHRLRMPTAALGCGLVAASAWMALAGHSTARAFEHPSWSELWGGAEVWPLLASAALAGAVAAVRRLPVPARVAAAGTAELALVVAVATPVLDEGVTEAAGAGLVALLVAGAACLLLPARWKLSSAPVQVVAGIGLLVMVLAQLAFAVERLLEVADPVWQGAAADRLGPWADAAQPAPWLLPLAAAAVLLTLWVQAQASLMLDRIVSPVADLRVQASVFAAALVATVALYPVAVWLVVASLLLVATAFAGWWLVTASTVPLLPTGLFAASAVTVSLHSSGLTAAALTVVLAIGTLAHLRVRSTTLSAVAGSLVSVTTAALVWTIGHLLDGAAVWVTLTALLLLGGLVLVAPYAPARWWAGSEAHRRSGLEVGAAAAAVPLVTAGVSLAAQPSMAGWLAVYLTTAGVVVTLVALLREDRRSLGWVGGGLLALASWVRLWDLGVGDPEAYTLPSAAALLVVGLLRLRRDPATSTISALGPGLALGLTPSLLWALAEEPGWRAVLLGLACLALVLLGVRLRWTAPLAIGAAVGALLVLRLAAPYVGDAVPRWVLIGAAGALLIAVGATWERRLTDARQVVAYVRALR